MGDFIKDKNNSIYAVIHIVEKSETVLSPEFKTLLSAFPLETQHLIYNSRFRNSTDSIEDLARLSTQVKLVSSIHRILPACMPDLASLNKEYVEKYVATTEAVDLMFP